jgi:oligoribonuclease (3'-5' exoribonuclease)
MNLDAKVIRNSETAYRSLDGEGLIMNPSDSTLHSLDEVASCIWEFIAEEHTVREVVDRVLERFACERAEAEGDVLEFLDALQERRLAKIVA